MMYLSNMNTLFWLFKNYKKLYRPCAFLSGSVMMQLQSVIDTVCRVLLGVISAGATCVFQAQSNWSGETTGSLHVPVSACHTLRPADIHRHGPSQLFIPPTCLKLQWRGEKKQRRKPQWCCWLHAVLHWLRFPREPALSWAQGKVIWF